MQHVPQIRVFLSSPGDVNDERTIARQLIEDLPYRPLLRDKIAVRIIAWDKVVAGAALRANMKPQEAINKGLPRPSQCAINIVIFWSRMGTEFTDEDGKLWQSGTHWELHDALFNAPHSRTVIYRSHIKPKSLDDPFSPDYDSNKDQWDKLNRFLKSDLFYKDGQIQRSITQYASLDEFRTKLATDLEEFIAEILTEENISSLVEFALPPAEQVIEVSGELWSGSPFPGLRAFDVGDARIFFGRGRETDDLIRRVEANRFTAVIAASGSGKSSLVAAGLIPRLQAGAIIAPETNSKAWRVVRFTPGSADSPFEALFNGLCAAFPEHSISPFSLPKERRDFVESIKASPKSLIDICHALLAEANAPDWSEILVFVDQFEELFTVVKPDDRAAFIVLLNTIHLSHRLRCIVTMRSDFYANCVELPALAALLNAGSYSLTAPTAGALYEMITRPAERAGLSWDDGLPGHILADTGSNAGALALMAYALDELYKVSHVREDKRLTFEAYAAIDGVAGAIGKRAESVFDKLTLPDKDRLLQRVFRELVVVDERGTATRQRATAAIFNADEMALIRAFANARLLVTDNNSVEVAHEAVFRSWDRLKHWITEAQEDLILLRQVRSAAEEWARKGQPDFLRWPAERLTPVYAMIERQETSLNESERDFIEPEQARLLRELERLDTDHERRRDIGDRLAVIGDTRPGIGVKDGIPDMVWLPVDVSPDPVTIKTDEYEIGPITIPPFFIAKYQVTYAQFQAFAKANDGFNDDRWWIDMPDEFKKQKLESQRTKTSNGPRDNVSWYQSAAFVYWLNYQLYGVSLAHLGSNKILIIGENAQVRLPTEWEWQWAAQGGVKALAYPWGNW